MPEGMNVEFSRKLAEQEERERSSASALGSAR